MTYFIKKGTMYFTDKLGQHRFEKFSVTRERTDIINNPLFESIFKVKEVTPEVIMKVY